MESGYSLATFVPFYIFAPMILIGIVELLRTPASTGSFNERTTPYAKDPLTGSTGSTGSRVLSRMPA